MSVYKKRPAIEVGFSCLYCRTSFVTRQITFVYLSSNGSAFMSGHALALFLSNIIFPRPLEQHQPPTIIYWWLWWGVLTGEGEGQVPTIGVQRPC